MKKYVENMKEYEEMLRTKVNPYIYLGKGLV